MSEPRPLRLRILDELTKLFETIPGMQGKVFRGRVFYGDDDPIPMISILEPPIPPDGIPTRGPNPNSKVAWELLIQGFVKDDKDNPTDPAHILMAKVKKVIADEKKEMSRAHPFLEHRQIIEVEIGQGAVRPADSVSAHAFFWLPLSLTLGENMSDPYS